MYQSPIKLLLMLVSMITGHCHIARRLGVLQHDFSKSLNELDKAETIYRIFCHCLAYSVPWKDFYL